MLEIERLIRDYQTLSGSFTSALRDHFKVKDLLRAWHQGLIPKDGRLDGGKFSFSFHGAGCTVEGPSLYLNFDIGYEQEASRFDAWKLWQFALSRKNDFPMLQELDAVKAALPDAHRKR